MSERSLEELRHTTNYLRFMPSKYLVKYGWPIGVLCVFCDSTATGCLIDDDVDRGVAVCDLHTDKIAAEECELRFSTFRFQEPWTPPVQTPKRKWWRR